MHTDMPTHAKIHSKNKHTQNWISLCAEVWEDKQYAASVSLRQTELAEVNADTSLQQENGEHCVCVEEHGKVDHFLLFCNFIKEI